MQLLCMHIELRFAPKANLFNGGPRPLLRRAPNLPNLPPARRPRPIVRIGLRTGVWFGGSHGTPDQTHTTLHTGSSVCGRSCQAYLWNLLGSHCSNSARCNAASHCILICRAWACPFGVLSEAIALGSFCFCFLFLCGEVGGGGSYAPEVQDAMACFIAPCLSLLC